jgi:type II secretory pathway component GspD/PulD (secretin)
MGLGKWVGGCALFAMLAGATWLGAQEKKSAEDPFGGSKAATPAAAAPAKEKAAEKKSAKPAPPPSSPAEARRRIERALDQPLKAPMNFTEQPLRQVAQILADEYELPVQFDTKALDAVAATPDQEVTVQISNVSLRSALDLMLKNAGAEQLTYVVDNEVLLITTEEEANKKLEVRVYRVDDLVSSLAAYDDLDALIEIVSSNVEHDSWVENGTGEGEIHAFQPAMLIVSNTHRVHDQIDRLLADMRQTKDAIRNDSLAEQQSGSQKLVTRGIWFEDKSIGDSAETRSLLQDVLVQSVDWQPDGKEVENSFLHILPNHVIVRHQPRVVDQVEQIVHSILGPRPAASRGSSNGDAKVSAAPGGMGGGGGGNAGGGGGSNASTAASTPGARPGFF